jgi:putative ABC transport system permease protein
MDAARELRIAVRRLVRAPLFTALCILIQAVGVGITVSAGTLFCALFQVRPIRDISNVVDIQRMRPPGSNLARSDVEFIRAHQDVFSDLLPWAVEFGTFVVRGRAPRSIPVEAVGANYFEFVGQKMRLGRAFLPEDDRDGSPLVAVISETLWRGAFNGDPHLVGRAIELSDHRFEVVGVVGSSFRGLFRPNASRTVIWIPLAAARVLNSWTEASDEQLGFLRLEGRLKSGVSMAQARAQSALLAAQMDREHPPQTGGLNEPFAVKRTYRLRPASTVRIDEPEDVTGLPLGKLAMATTLLVFLIVCVNLAILSVARAIGRRHEAAIRMSVGASPARLAGTHALDAALLSLAGAAAGWLATTVLLGRMVVTVHSWHGFKDFEIGRGDVFSALLVVTSLACFLAGAVPPAVMLRRRRVAEFLWTTASVGGVPNRSLRLALIVVQIALSFVLVSAGALCSRQLAVAAAYDSGIDLDRLAVVLPDFAGRAFGPSPPPPRRVRRTSEQVLSQVKVIPGVETAALSSGLPFGSTAFSSGWITTPDRPFLERLRIDQQTHLLVSTPEVFRTLGIRLSRGRYFDSRDAEGTEPVVVITELTASKLFGPGYPIGRRVLFLRQRWEGQPPPEVQTLTVIGVVRDVDSDVVGRRSEGVAFVPFAQSYFFAMAVVARAEHPEDVLEAMRTAVWKVDPDTSVALSGTGPRMGGTENLPLLGTARASALLGGAALLFSMGGLGSLLWTLVNGRRREIAIRVALGATPAVTAWAVVREGLKPVIAGIGAGILLSIGASMALRPMFLRYLPSLNPVVIALVSLFIVIVALATSYVPARQAASSSPQAALKEM